MSDNSETAAVDIDSSVESVPPTYLVPPESAGKKQQAAVLLNDTLGSSGKSNTRDLFMQKWRRGDLGAKRYDDSGNSYVTPKDHKHLTRNYKSGAKRYDDTGTSHVTAKDHKNSTPNYKSSHQQSSCQSLEAVQSKSSSSKKERFRINSPSIESPNRRVFRQSLSSSEACSPIPSSGNNERRQINSISSDDLECRQFEKGPKAKSHQEPLNKWSKRVDQQSQYNSEIFCQEQSSWKNRRGRFDSVSSEELESTQLKKKQVTNVEDFAAKKAVRRPDRPLYDIRQRRSPSIANQAPSSVSANLPYEDAHLENDAYLKCGARATSPAKQCELSINPVWVERSHDSESSDLDERNYVARSKEYSSEKNILIFENSSGNSDSIARSGNTSSIKKYEIHKSERPGSTEMYEVHIPEQLRQSFQDKNWLSGIGRNSDKSTNSNVEGLKSGFNFDGDPDRKICVGRSKEYSSEKNILIFENSSVRSDFTSSTKKYKVPERQRLRQSFQDKNWLSGHGRNSDKSTNSNVEGFESRFNVDSVHLDFSKKKATSINERGNESVLNEVGNDFSLKRDEKRNDKGQSSSHRRVLEGQGSRPFEEDRKVWPGKCEYAMCHQSRYQGAKGTRTDKAKLTQGFEATQNPVKKCSRFTKGEIPPRFRDLQAGKPDVRNYAPETNYKQRVGNVRRGVRRVAFGDFRSGFLDNIKKQVSVGTIDQFLTPRGCHNSRMIAEVVVELNRDIQTDKNLSWTNADDMQGMEKYVDTSPLDNQDLFHLDSTFSGSSSTGMNSETVKNNAEENYAQGNFNSLLLNFPEGVVLTNENDDTLGKYNGFYTVVCLFLCSLYFVY